MRFPFCTAFLIAALLPVQRSGAQDTTRRGVTIGLTYDPASRPGIAVLPVTGSSGDSIRAILQRDLDYSDRLTVIPLEASDPSPFRGTKARPDLNYSPCSRL